MMAGGYIAVLLTNWRYADSGGEARVWRGTCRALFLVVPVYAHSIISGTSSSGAFVIDKGFGSTWAKMGSSWVLFIFYMWSLIAPIVWPSRFGAV